MNSHSRLLWIVLLCLLFVVPASIFVVSCDDDDDTGTNPETEVNDLLDGIWQITITPKVDSVGEASTIEEILLYEYNGSVIGYTDRFILQGSRDENRLLIDVISMHAETGEKESEMVLELCDDDTIRGSGSSQDPRISIPHQADGTVHEKFQTIHEDWDGGLGGVHFYDILAIRVGNAPVMQHKADVFRSPQDWTDWSINLEALLCGMIYELSSTFIDDLYGTEDYVPFGPCQIEWDGGGVYLYGRTGPGNINDMYSNTVYHPYEWVSCGSRTYHFTISLSSFGNLLYNISLDPTVMPASFYEPLGVTAEELASQANEMYNSLGEYAICLGYSYRTNNTSIYVLNYYEDAVWDEALVQTYVNWLEANAPGGIWYFSGTRVHDTWGLSRDWQDDCSSQLLFTYLIGTSNVNFD